MENEIDIAKSNMHRKWFVIPYSILVIMWAGAPYNLQERWKFRMEQQGFEESAENYTFLAVLSGYYFGLFSGIVVHRLDSKYAYAIAAILAFVGYVGIGIGIKIMEAGILEISIMIALFFMISFSASLAMMSAVNMPIDWFDRYASFLIIGLLIGYIKITPVFESAIERKWFKRVADKIEDTENRTTLDDNIDLIYDEWFL